MKRASIATIGLLSMLLSACSSLLHSKDEPDHFYLLRAVPAAAGPAAVPGVLSVLRPVVQPGFDTDLIMLTRGQELDHFAASRWGASLPGVIAALAVQSLAGGGGFANVAEAGRGGVPSDYELQLTVRHFEAAYADASTAAPVIQVAFECTVTAGSPRRVLGHCDAAASEPASANRMGAIVAAMEVATQRALMQVRTAAVAAASAAGK